MPPWEPHGEFVPFGQRVVPLPAASLKRSVESADIFHTWARLAASIGPQGSQYALRLLETQLRRSIDQHAASGAETDRAASGDGT
jgi:hypothetical protein